MAKTYNRLEIDVNKKPTDIMVQAVQADSNSRYLDVTLFSNGVPLNLTGHEVRIFMKKPENGGEIWNNGEITDAAAGRCQFLMTTEALAKMGHLQTQISVWKDNREILSTQIFEVYVTKSLLSDSAVESSNEYGALVVLFQNLYEAHALMTSMVNSFGSKGAISTARDIGTFWQALEYIAKYADTDLKGKLDEAIAKSSTKGVLDLIGTAGDTGNATLFGLLKEVEKSSRKICKASNTVLATIINAETAGLNNAAIEKRMLIVGFSGIVRLKYSIKGTYNTRNTVTIYKDNFYIKESSAVGAAVRVAQNEYTYTDYTTAYVDIPVKDGDILRFSYLSSLSGQSVYCNLLTVCGTLSDAAVAVVAL